VKVVRMRICYDPAIAQVLTVQQATALPVTMPQPEDFRAEEIRHA
jgi:hypothetical protein